MNLVQTDVITEAMNRRRRLQQTGERSTCSLLLLIAVEERYVEVLMAPNSDIEHSGFHWDVYQAFLNAELSDLITAREVCVRMMKFLDARYRVNLLRGGRDRQDFWSEVVQDAKPVLGVPVR